jgi:HemY protein
MRALPAVIVIALLVAVAAFFAERPGNVSLTWQGWEVETSVAVLVLGVVVLAMLAAALFHLLRKLLGGPRAFLRARREKRRREGYRALTQGMVAVAAGDAEEAQKYARKADVLLAEPPLTLLLSAQAAQLSGDEQAARKYFHAMLERAETEFLGLRGLVMQALRGGDEGTALRLVERARELRPRTPWVLTSLVELQARAGRWEHAAATLAEAVKRKVLDAAASRRQRAVLLYEQSRAAEAGGDARQALKHAAEAHTADPGLVPAAVHYSTLLRVSGRKRQAARVIEAAWRALPHPDLHAAWSALFAEESPLNRVKHMDRLAAQHPEHRESRLMQAAAALEARLWGEARRHLEAAGAKPDGGAPPPSARVCQKMAELEEAQHGDAGLSARSWLARAATTPTPDPTYVCDACGGESPEWHALCPHCRAFASLTWRLPNGRVAARRALPAAAPPALTPSAALPLPPHRAGGETRTA